MKQFRYAFSAVAIIAAGTVFSAPFDKDNLPTVQVAKWKNDAKSAVTLFYDDGCPTALKIVVPTITKYHVPGTFYLMLGNLNDQQKKQWEEAAKLPEVTIGNHTLNHNGATNTTHLAEQVSKADPILRQITGLDANALVSFAQPGGVPWKVSKEELKAELDRNNSLLRNDFLIAWSDRSEEWFIRTAADGIRMILDEAEKSGNRKSMLCHGVGGDWLSFNGDEHEKFIAEVKNRMDANRLWVAPEIAVQKYIAERDAFAIDFNETTFNDAYYSFKANPGTNSAYDEPLTIKAQIPAGYTKAKIRINSEAPFEAEVRDGYAVFEMAPRAAVVFVGFSK